MKCRENELHNLRQFVFQDGSTFPEEVRRIIDPASVVVGGFSYGGATAALSVVLHPEDYCACVLLVFPPPVLRCLFLLSCKLCFLPRFTITRCFWRVLGVSKVAEKENEVTTTNVLLV